ncbi:MAG: triose-phosphate isomerase [Bradyrhizobiaceae bacterium]|nr:MAG: triose-phosphate isomerase [Bradyrhizobiaceae bacterium]
MTTRARPLIAGNWKMNGLTGSLAELDAIIAGSSAVADRADLLICPPATLVAAFAARAKGTAVMIGGQDCHPEPCGAHTGDIAAEMLKDAGASFVIVGHSERRADHHETDELVRQKTLAAWRAGLVAIVCVGETGAERDAGQTLDVVGRQIERSVPDGARTESLVVAYEPVWAIGTGVTPTTSDVEQIHAFICLKLSKKMKNSGESSKILYGGSVKPSNCNELLCISHVNGALVGGASLKSSDFLAIAAAAPK